MKRERRERKRKGERNGEREWGCENVPVFQKVIARDAFWSRRRKPKCRCIVISRSYLIIYLLNYLSIRCKCSKDQKCALQSALALQNESRRWTKSKEAQIILMCVPSSTRHRKIRCTYAYSRITIVDPRWISFSCPLLSSTFVHREIVTRNRNGAIRAATRRTHLSHQITYTYIRWYKYI